MIWLKRKQCITNLEISTSPASKTPCQGHWTLEFLFFILKCMIRLYYKCTVCTHIKLCNFTESHSS